MKLTVEHFYKLVFDVNGKGLTYTGKITEDDDKFVSFIDKFGNSLSYNKLNLISAEEIE